jgi:hypothetical protein
VTGDTHTRAERLFRQNHALCSSAAADSLGLCRKPRLAFVQTSPLVLAY